MQTEGEKKYRVKENWGRKKRGISNVSKKEREAKLLSGASKKHFEDSLVMYRMSIVPLTSGKRRDDILMTARSITSR